MSIQVMEVDGTTTTELTAADLTSKGLKLQTAFKASATTEAVSDRTVGADFTIPSNRPTFAFMVRLVNSNAKPVAEMQVPFGVDMSTVMQLKTDLDLAKSTITTLENKMSAVDENATLVPGRLLVSLDGISNIAQSALKQTSFGHATPVKAYYNTPTKTIVFSNAADDIPTEYWTNWQLGSRYGATGTATGWTPYTDRDYRVYDTATKKWKYYYFYAHNWYEKS